MESARRESDVDGMSVYAALLLDWNAALEDEVVTFEDYCEREEECAEIVLAA